MTTNRNQTVALNVRAAIANAGTTVEAIAQDAAVPATTLRRHLADGRLTVPELVAIAEVLDTDPGAFFKHAPPATKRTAA